MKQYITLCAIVVCAGFMSGLNAQTIQCVNNPDNREVVIYFTNPKYHIIDTVLPLIFNNSQVFNWINVEDEDFGIIDSVGMPTLPQLTFNINIPENAVAVDFHIEDSILDIVYASKEILPCQMDFCAEDTHSYFPFSINNTFYLSDNFYFPQRVVLSNPYRIRDKLGVSVTLFPYMYSPKYKEIRVLEGLTIKIRYILDGTASDAPASSVFEDYFENFFKNYTPATTGLEPPRYLIITPKKYSDDLDPFVEYKQSIGYEVEKILIDPEDMSSAMVKSVIQARYNDIKFRPDYVLLVGDSLDLPPAQGNCLGDTDNNPITDVPYVMLEGNDYEVDAFIGRWPVSTASELHNIIHKTIYMEMNMQQLDKRALFVSGDDSHWYSSFMRWSFETAHEYAIEETFEPEGYSCELRCQSYLSTVREWMEWNPLIFAYSGHGLFTEMGQLYNNETNGCITDSFFSEYQNETFPMVFSFACKTGNFAYPRNVSIAESWIRKENGGVTFLGSSVRTDNIADIVLEKKIFGEAFFDVNKRNIGKVIELGKRRFREHSYYTGWYSNQYSRAYNLMGDPSFLVRGLNCPCQYIINGDNIVVGNDKEYRAENRIMVGDGVLIDSGNYMFLSAGSEIIFEDGFESLRGAEVEAIIESCNNRSNVMSKAHPLVEKEEINLVTSIDNLVPASFRLYPNPTDNEVVLEFYANNSENVRMVVYNMQGVVVWEKVIPIVSVGIQSIDIPLMNVIPSGIYIVSLFVDDQMYTETLIMR